MGRTTVLLLHLVCPRLLGLLEPLLALFDLSLCCLAVELGLECSAVVEAIGNTSHKRRVAHNLRERAYCRVSVWCPV